MTTTHPLLPSYPLSRAHTQVLSSARAPEAGLVYLRNFLAARGSRVLSAAAAAAVLAPGPAGRAGRAGGSLAPPRFAADARPTHGGGGDKVAGESQAPTAAGHKDGSDTEPPPESDPAPRLGQWDRREKPSGGPGGSAAGAGEEGKLQGTRVLDLRCLSMSSLPREAYDLVWGGSMQRSEDTVTRIQHIRLDGNPLADLPRGRIRGWWGVRRLSLCNCLLRSLPLDLADPDVLCSLEQLEAADNAIRVLPAPPGGWPRLRRLNLDCNDFAALPDGLGRLTALTQLSVRHNHLVALPRSIRYLGRLTTLLLGDNRLERLPPELGVLAALFPAPADLEMAEHRRRGGPELDYVQRPPGTRVPPLPPDPPPLPDWDLTEDEASTMSRARIAAALTPPPTAAAAGRGGGGSGGGGGGGGGGGWRSRMDQADWPADSLYGSLIELEVAGNPSLWSPPPEVMEQGLAEALRFLRALFDARHTGSLDLHDMGLVRLPPEVLELASDLHSLWLSFNNLDCLPICAEELTRLRVLHVHHNQLLRLPPSLGLALMDLRDLDISSNCLRRVPLELANLVKLERFAIADNPWEMVPSEMIGRGTVSLLAYLVSMHDSVHGTLDLQNMGMTTYALADVHRGLPRPDAVNTIHLEDNTVRLLPKAWRTLTSVTSLSLDRNKLHDLPRWIVEWPVLRRVSLSHNLVHALQPALGRCASLEKLYLDSNFLVYLPNALLGLTSLRFLRADCNRLATLNPSVTYCHLLQRLWLHLNELTMLPPELSYLTALTELRLEGNSLKSPPAEVQAGGCRSILRYLGCLQVGSLSLPCSIPPSWGFLPPFATSAACRSGVHPSLVVQPFWMPGPPPSPRCCTTQRQSLPPSLVHSFVPPPIVQPFEGGGGRLP